MHLSVNEIKSVRSLSSKKFRDESGLFIVEGEKMVDEALHSRFEVVKVYRREEVGEETMSRLSQFSTPSPVLAVLRKPAPQPVKVEKGLYLALDSIRDPGNLGTILRIADWFGIKSVVATPDTVEVFNPKVVQATMGAIFRVDFHYTELTSFARDVLEAGGRVYGTFLDGRNIYSRDLATGGDSPSVIVIGNESNGISDAMASLVSDRLYIPPFPEGAQTSESLNAAVATAVTVAEFRRRIWAK
ncbi:MAG: RNA methyltransferase [Bacteroidales bacterium]|nr:RNA methyltransferase [Candidatus Cryptobacteroides onthequi]